MFRFQREKRLANNRPIQVLKAILPSNNLAAIQHLNDTIDKSILLGLAVGFEYVAE